MGKRKITLESLWLGYINQPLPIPLQTMDYVTALRARVDQLEISNAVLRGQLRQVEYEKDTAR